MSKVVRATISAENQVLIKVLFIIGGKNILVWIQYQSSRDDQRVIDKLTELAEQLPTRGLDTYCGRLRQQGIEWSRNKVLRVYRLMKLKLRRKHKRRLPGRFPANCLREQSPAF